MYMLFKAKNDFVLYVLHVMLVSSLSMFDVGGQRDERRKWIQCFNGKYRTTHTHFCSGQ